LSRRGSAIECWSAGSAFAEHHGSARFYHEDTKDTKDHEERALARELTLNEQTNKYK
jgi:hypothetical protein